MDFPGQFQTPRDFHLRLEHQAPEGCKTAVVNSIWGIAAKQLTLFLRPLPSPRVGQGWLEVRLVAGAQ